MTVRAPSDVLPKVLPSLARPAQPLARKNPIGTALQDLFGGTHASYKAKLRGMDDKQLASEATRLRSVIADASSGPNKNPSVAARARAQLGEIREEQKTRADFCKSENPAYSRQVHSMSDQQISSERAKQMERYHEATTGFDRDPKKAADAKQKLEILGQETFGRFKDQLQGALPREVPTKPMGFFDQVGYSVKASKLSPAELRQEKAKVLGELRDAKTGAHKDPTAAANAQKKLDILSRYERPSCKPISHEDLKKYQHRCGQRGSGELKADIAKLRDELKQACGKDPVAEGNCRSKLGVLEGALRTREGEVHKLSKWASCASDAELSKACDGYQKHLDHSRPDYGKTLEDLDVVTCEQHKRCRGGDEARRPERPEGQKCEEQSLKDLLTDLVKNLERFHEATTGFDKDPKVAKDAMNHLREDLGELLRRVFQQALSAAA